MKQIYFLLLIGAVACTRQPADHFVLRGVVPGAMDSTRVMLKTLNGQDMQKFTGYIIDEKFELRGKLDGPTHCRLNLDNYDYIKSIGGDLESSRTCNIDLFVENGELAFTTPHLDSLPQAFWRYDIRKEKNYRLEGSPAQDAYYRYQQQTIPLRYDLYKLRGKENFTLEENRQINAMMEQLHEIGKAFIRNNSNLAANLYVAESLKKSPFTYDRAYLDELEQLFASYQDTCAGLKNFRQYLKDAACWAKGAPLQEGEVTDKQGKAVSLAGQLNPEGYTLIDFWASWCGPCRASFPHLREMYKRYGGKMRFVSVSVDQKEEDWQRAMKDEQLPWGQFLSTPALNKVLPKVYGLRSIPTFLIVDSDGKIIFSGHSSGDLELQLDELFS